MNFRTASGTLVLGGLGLLVVAALGWLLLLGPVTGKISAVGEERVQAQDRAVLMRSQLNSLRLLTGDIPDISTQAAELDRVFPPTADQPGFFSAVTKAAEDAGIPASDITTLSPGVPVVPGGEPGAPVVEGDALPDAQLALQEVTITAVGSYDQLAQLMANLEDLDRALLVASASMAADDEQLTLTLVGTTFVAAPLGDAPEIAS